MELLIDAQSLQTPASAHRGIGRYTRNLIQAIQEARPAWNITLIQNERLRPIDRQRTASLPVVSFSPPFSLEERNTKANELFYADWLSARRPDCILLPSIFEREAVIPWFVGRHPKLACVLYDLIPLVYPEHYLRDAVAFTSYARHLRRLADTDLVLTISESTARDFKRFLPYVGGQTINIAGSTDPTFSPLPQGQLEEVWEKLKGRAHLNQEFLLTVGGEDFRKNMIGVLRTFAALPETYLRQYDLVIACYLSEKALSQLQEAASQLGIAGRAKPIGYVSDVELIALYQRCRLFLFPSLYEGMGLPVLEALRCGAPVVASNVSSIPEYAGSCTWLADPHSPEALAEAVRQALAEPRAARMQDRLDSAKRFEWKRTAALACGALEGLVRNSPRKCRFAQRRRKRIAFVSPLPPSHTGIADYAAELLEPLAQHFDIELVVDPLQPKVTKELRACCRVLQAEELTDRHAAAPFDLFVYQLGNSHYHHYMLRLMSRFRGLVVLHDYYLAGMLSGARQAGCWPFTVDEDLTYEGETQMADWLRRDIFPGWAVDCSHPLNRRILHLAAEVVVHSGWSWQRVRRIVNAPVHLVPQIVPIPQLGSAREERRRLGLPAEAFLIGTLGQLGHPKRIEIMIQALARLPESLRRQTRLLLVGEGSPELQAMLRRLADSLGVGRLIDYVGRVPLSDLSAYARAVDVCVQLRYPTHGETSASLLRALAAGAACIISDQGPMAEVPRDVAWRVRAPHHEVEDLVSGLCHLHADPQARQALAEAGRGYIQKHHGLERVASPFAAVMEHAIARRQARDENWQDHVSNALADCSVPEASERWLDPWLCLRQEGQQCNSAEDVSENDFGSHAAKAMAA